MGIELLKAEFMNDQITEGSIASSTERLQEWHASLPREWNLSELMPEDGSLGRHTVASLGTEGLLLLHVLYLGTTILFHNRRLRASAISDTSEAEGPGMVFTQAEETIAAAHLMARIFILLNSDSNVYRRCWFCVCVFVDPLLTN